MASPGGIRDPVSRELAGAGTILRSLWNDYS